MEIPIDPALLDDEGGLEDAEGEVDEEYIVPNVCFPSPLFTFVDAILIFISQATSTHHSSIYKTHTTHNMNTNPAHRHRRARSPSPLLPPSRSGNHEHQPRAQSQDASAVSTATPTVTITSILDRKLKSTV